LILRHTLLPLHLRLPQQQSHSHRFRKPREPGLLKNISRRKTTLSRSPILQVRTVSAGADAWLANC
jgi:hypothetical protein